MGQTVGLVTVCKVSFASSFQTSWPSLSYSSTISTAHGANSPLLQLSKLSHKVKQSKTHVQCKQPPPKFTTVQHLSDHSKNYITVWLVNCPIISVNVACILKHLATSRNRDVIITMYAYSNDVTSHCVNSIGEKVCSCFACNLSLYTNHVSLIYPVILTKTPVWGRNVDLVIDFLLGPCRAVQWTIYELYATKVIEQISLEKESIDQYVMAYTDILVLMHAWTYATGCDT
jgi:hypothetical protein